MLILAVIIAVALTSSGAYIAIAPDDRTLKASRGAASGLRAWWSSAAETTRAGWSSRSGTAPKTSSKTGGKTTSKTGSKTSSETAPRTGSETGWRLGWARTKTGLRRTKLLARAARTGLRAAKTAYQDRAAKAVEDRRTNRAKTKYEGWYQAGRIQLWRPRWLRRTSRRASEDFSAQPEGQTQDPVQDPKKESPVSEGTVGGSDGFSDPGAMQEAVDDVRTAAQEVLAAQARLEAAITSLKEKYKASGFSTEGLNQGVGGLSEADNDGTSIMERLPALEEDITAAANLGEHAASIDADGDVPAFRKS